MNPDLKHITLFAFEQKLKDLNISFAYFDETQKEAGLILGVSEFYEMYAREVYDLCTSNPILKKDPTIKKLLKDAKTAKEDKAAFSSYTYKGDKPNKITYRWDFLMPIYDYCAKSIDFILSSLGLEPFHTARGNTYMVLNFEVCSPLGEGKGVNVQRPWALGDKEFKDLDIHVIFCFLMKVNELLNEHDFYIYPKHLKTDYGDYM